MYGQIYFVWKIKWYSFHSTFVIYKDTLGIQQLTRYDQVKDMYSFFFYQNSRGVCKQTQNICMTFVQCWINVENISPTLYKCCTNAGIIIIICLVS